jgi:hypothetical protein
MLTTPAQRAASKRWRDKHPEQARATVKRSYAARMADPIKREKGRAANRRYYTAHPDRVRAAHKRWRSQPKNMMADRLRSRLRAAYQHGLTSSIEQLLACSMKEFRAHIASKFQPGMTRLNHGAIWQFDHIVPCSKFDLTDPEQQKQCFHFSNIQPLFKRDNQLKHNRVAPYPEAPTDPKNPITFPQWTVDRETTAREWTRDLPRIHPPAST